MAQHMAWAQRTQELLAMQLGQRRACTGCTPTSQEAIWSMPVLRCLIAAPRGQLRDVVSRGRHTRGEYKRPYKRGGEEHRDHEKGQRREKLSHPVRSLTSMMTKSRTMMLNMSGMERRITRIIRARPLTSVQTCTSLTTLGGAEGRITQTGRDAQAAWGCWVLDDPDGRLGSPVRGAP